MFDCCYGYAFLSGAAFDQMSYAERLVRPQKLAMTLIILESLTQPSQIHIQSRMKMIHEL